MRLRYRTTWTIIAIVGVALLVVAIAVLAGPHHFCEQASPDMRCELLAMAA